MATTKKIDEDIEKITGGDQTSEKDTIKYERPSDAIAFEKPGKKPKRLSNASWKPANLIEVPKEYQNPYFDYRCVDKHRPGRIQQKLNEGWEIDTEIVRRMKADGYFDHIPATMQDGVPKDNTLQFRELIVMRISKELKEERQKYIKAQNPLRGKLKETDDKLKEDLGKLGVQTYGETKLN